MWYGKLDQIGRLVSFRSLAKQILKDEWKYCIVIVTDQGISHAHTSYEKMQPVPNNFGMSKLKTWE